jgi:hypothetical protein
VGSNPTRLAASSSWWSLVDVAFAGPVVLIVLVAVVVVVIGIALMARR